MRNWLMRRYIEMTNELGCCGVGVGCGCCVALLAPLGVAAGLLGWRVL